MVAYCTEGLAAGTGDAESLIGANRPRFAGTFSAAQAGRGHRRGPGGGGAQHVIASFYCGSAPGRVLDHTPGSRLVSPYAP